MKVNYIIILLLILSLLHSSFFGYKDVLPIQLLYILTFTPSILFIFLLTFNKIPQNKLLFLITFIIIISSIIHFRAENTIGETFTNINIFIHFLNGFLLSRFPKDIIVSLFEKYVPILGLILFPVFIIEFSNTSYVEMLRRSNTWEGSFFFLTIYTLAPHSLLISISKKKTIFQKLFLVCAIFSFLVYLKRIIIFDIILLLFILIIFKKIKIKDIIFLLIISVFIYSLFIPNLNDFIFMNDFIETRFSPESIENNGRDEEVLLFFKNSNIIDFIFGSGIDANNLFLEKKSQSLHSGWFNFIFKYGLIFMLYLLILSIHRIIKVKTPIWIKSLLLFFCFKFLITNSYYISPEITLFSYALFYRNED
jgi:hypothetical protein